VTPEKAIQNEILSFLRSLGCYCWQVYNGAVYDQKRQVYRKSRSAYTINGVSDILGIFNGRFLAIEVKSKTGIVSEHQRVFLRRINEEGGIAFVARSARQAALELGKHFPEDENIRRYYQ
jgi:hypothetical protein